ncbi:MAG: hypothetical protein OXU79_01575 [Gemmatimonadota bacterium]|nr:hypothetical protein [Gemmatimonadota bacterium]
MNFKRDLIEIVKHYFATEGISFEDTGDASDFAARYCEMRIRRIVPRPRDVHFSREIHDSLGSLAREYDKEGCDTKFEAWHTVFYLRQLFVSGESVLPHLSRGVENTATKDGLLWDYGMHHFHLSRKLENSGFVERSDYLLFAIVADTDVYFVDVRRHHDPDNLLWVRQDLLRIVYVNWPELTDTRELHGVSGKTLTDKEIWELRRKNSNHISNLGRQAIAPLGGGTNFAGSSTLCRVWGDKLVREIEQHEKYFYSQPAELRATLEARGMKFCGDMAFELIPLDRVNLSEETVENLQRDDCLSAGLSKMGFAIVEATTRTPIVVTLTKGQSPQPTR